MRIRHYGFLANRCRRQRLEAIRVALNTPEVAASAEHSDITPGQVGASIPPPCPCPQCKQGRLIVIATLAPERRTEASPVHP